MESPHKTTASPTNGDYQESNSPRGEADEAILVSETRIARNRTRRTWVFLSIVFVIALAVAVTVILLVKNKNAITDVSLEAPQEIKKMPVYKYRCTANQCVYQNLTKAEMIAQTPTMGPGLMSLRVCEMTCGNGSMLPLPTSVSFGSADTVAVDITSFSHSVSGADGSLVKDMQAAFTELLQYKKKLAVGGIQDSG
ncbi:hypothetical protein As57867_005973, partial [Aphanomyces stellatus]